MRCGGGGDRRGEDEDEVMNQAEEHQAQEEGERGSEPKEGLDPASHLPEGASEAQLREVWWVAGLESLDCFFKI